MTLLAPLARLLKIDLNTLVSFHENLSDKEIALFSNKVAEVIKEQGFQAGFAMAADQIQEYPTCGLLLYSITILLDGELDMSGLSSEEKVGFEQQLMKWYERAANNQKERVQKSAIYMLSGKYLRRNEMEKAQEMANLLPDKQPIDKDMLQIHILLQQGEYAKSAKLTERKLLRTVTHLQNLLITLVDIEIAADEMQMASQIAHITQHMVKLLDLWEYSAYVSP